MKIFCLITTESICKNELTTKLERPWTLSPFRVVRAFRGSFIDSLLASQQCHTTGMYFAVQFV
jgi:hypothetical protein